MASGFFGDLGKALGGTAQAVGALVSGFSNDAQQSQADASERKRQFEKTEFDGGMQAYQQAIAKLYQAAAEGNTQEFQKQANILNAVKDQLSKSFRGNKDLLAQFDQFHMGMVQNLQSGVQRQGQEQAQQPQGQQVPGSQPMAAAQNALQLPGGQQNPNLMAQLPRDAYIFGGNAPPSEQQKALLQQQQAFAQFDDMYRQGQITDEQRTDYKRRYRLENIPGFKLLDDTGGKNMHALVGDQWIPVTEKNGHLFKINGTELDRNTVKDLRPEPPSQTESKAARDEKDAEALYREKHPEIDADKPLKPSQKAQAMADYKDATMDPLLKQQKEEGIARQKQLEQQNKERHVLAEEIAEAIMNGDQPADLIGLSRSDVAAEVRAILEKHHFDYKRAQADWIATKRAISSMNSPQQQRIRENLAKARKDFDLLERLYNDWQKTWMPKTGMRYFNKKELQAAMNLPGKAGAAAQQLYSTANLVAGDMGSILMGSNSPTDHGLQMGQSMLSADWNQETFQKALDTLRIDIKNRESSMNNVNVVGINVDGTMGPVSSSGQPIQPQSGGQGGGQQQQSGPPSKNAEEWLSMHP